MKIIPVIDLLGGRAVWARGGRREAYRPLDTPLCHAGDALELAPRLLEYCAGDTLYLADLDAIRATGHNRALITAIAAAVPQATLWLDAGLADAAALDGLCRELPVRPVLGSETLRELAPLAIRDPVLSLDARDGSEIALADLLSQPQCWPRDVILMSLERVGAGQGPDLARLAHYRSVRADVRYYSAGGVRDAHDLQALRAAGAAGVLLASALHQGRIAPAQLRASD